MIFLSHPCWNVCMSIEHPQNRCWLFDCSTKRFIRKLIFNTEQQQQLHQPHIFCASVWECVSIQSFHFCWYYCYLMKLLIRSLYLCVFPLIEQSCEWFSVSFEFLKYWSSENGNGRNSACPVFALWNFRKFLPNQIFKELYLDNSYKWSLKRIGYSGDDCSTYVVHACVCVGFASHLFHLFDFMVVLKQCYAFSSISNQRLSALSPHCILSNPIFSYKRVVLLNFKSERINNIKLKISVVNGFVKYILILLLWNIVQRSCSVVRALCACVKKRLTTRSINI